MRGPMRILSLALLALTFAGCSTTQAPKAADGQTPVDPLIGVAPVGQPPIPGEGSVSLQKPVRMDGGVPPIPSQLEAANLASLAPSSAPRGRSLAISDGPSAVSAISPAGSQATDVFAPPARTPQVQAIPSETPPGAWAPPRQESPPSAAEALYAQLQARGVQRQKQEQIPGGVRLTCYVSTPGDPNSFRTFVATAVDYPAAAQAVLNQVNGK